MYGVGLEDEDKDSDDEDLNQASEVASSSPSDLHNPRALSSTSAKLAAQLVFKYHVDEAVLKAMKRGRMHEWTNIAFCSICKHGLSVKGAKGDLMEWVGVHFQRVYQL